MKRMILSCMLFLFLSSAFADKSKQVTIPTDKPIVTTWSKIKELFQ